MIQDKYNIDAKKIETLEVFKKLAPIARNSIGINTAEPALLSAIIFLLDRIDTNLEKLVEQTAKKEVAVVETEAKIAEETKTEAPKTGAKATGK